MKRLVVLSMVAWVGSALADASPAWIEISPQPLAPSSSVESAGAGAVDFAWCSRLFSDTLDKFKTTPPKGMVLIFR